MRHLRMMLTVLVLCLLALAETQAKPPKRAVTGAKSLSVMAPDEMALYFADSEMRRFPKAWNLDHGKTPYFGYTQGLGSCAMLAMWHATDGKKYFDYVAELADSIIAADGSIVKYRPEAYNLDFVNSGKYLFDVYAQTKDKKYRRAMDVLLRQLKNQPRTSDGGFWHKLIYQHQMWLDGLYMASPFMARFGHDFKKPEWINEALQQVITIHRHTYDPRTGLCHHAWDEAAAQRWADAEGHSPNFWGRSEGWYMMAVVDILDYVPEGYMFPLNMGHKDTVMVNGHDSLVSYLRELAEVLPRYQRGGLWYQVLDQPDRAGNWPEASVTCQLMYALAKAVRKGYIDPKYKRVALDAYEGLYKTRITDVRRTDEAGHVVGDQRDPMTYEYGAQHTMLMQLADGTVSLTQCCAVGGLGGSPHYRDGSYEYYIGERVRDNDAKATGPFIMGCLELAELK